MRSSKIYSFRYQIYPIPNYCSRTPLPGWGIFILKDFSSLLMVRDWYYFEGKIDIRGIIIVKTNFDSRPAGALFVIKEQSQQGYVTCHTVCQQHSISC